MDGAISGRRKNSEGIFRLKHVSEFFLRPEIAPSMQDSSNFKISPLVQRFVRNLRMTGQRIRVHRFHCRLLVVAVYENPIIKTRR